MWIIQPIKVGRYILLTRGKQATKSKERNILRITLYKEYYNGFPIALYAVARSIILKLYANWPRARVVTIIGLTIDKLALFTSNEHLTLFNSARNEGNVFHTSAVTHVSWYVSSSMIAQSLKDLINFNKWGKYQMKGIKTGVAVTNIWVLYFYSSWFSVIFTQKPFSKDIFL